MGVAGMWIGSNNMISIWKIGVKQGGRASHDSFGCEFDGCVGNTMKSHSFGSAFDGWSTAFTSSGSNSFFVTLDI